MYRMFKRVEDGLASMATIFLNYTVTQGTMIISKRAARLSNPDEGAATTKNLTALPLSHSSRRRHESRQQKKAKKEAA